MLSCSIANQCGFLFALAMCLPVPICALPLEPPLIPAPMVVAVSDCEGAIISSISVNLADIFDDPSEGAFYRTANNLKKNTAPEVITAELVLKEGEEFTNFAASESARNLRQLGYLKHYAF